MKIDRCPSCAKENVLLHPGTYTIKAHQKVYYDKMGHARKAPSQCVASGSDGIPFELGRVQRDVLYWNERIKERNEEIQKQMSILAEVEKKKKEATDKEALLTKVMQERQSGKK